MSHINLHKKGEKNQTTLGMFTCVFLFVLFILLTYLDCSYQQSQKGQYPCELFLYGSEGFLLHLHMVQPQELLLLQERKQSIQSIYILNIY